MRGKKLFYSFEINMVKLCDYKNSTHLGKERKNVASSCRGRMFLNFGDRIETLRRQVCVYRGVLFLNLQKLKIIKSLRRLMTLNLMLK